MAHEPSGRKEGDVDPAIAEILQFVNEVKLRVTHGTVAAVVGGGPQAVGRRLGKRRP